MMYLLLRDNKQSGPYSLDELKTKGLKAYDLVWVDGKSAAWRYPSEIDELSSFAPAVEEQPFDRFYKKTAAANTGTVNNNSANNNSNNNNNTVSSRPSGEPSTVPGKRIIYVTMPAGNGPAPAPVRQDAPAVPFKQEPPVQLKQDPAPAIFKEETRPVVYGLEDNYSQLSVDEPAAVEFLPRHSRPRTNRFVKPLVISLTVLALLAAGIFIGLSINKDTLPFQQKIATRTIAAENGQQNNTTAQQLPVPAVNKEPIPVSPEVQPDTVATIVGQSPNSQGTIAEPPVGRTAKTPSGVPAKERPVPAKTQASSPSVTKDSSHSVLSVAQHTGLSREAVHRTDAEEKTDNTAKDAGNAGTAKLNIASQVAVGANGYTVGTFGGITDLQVTVSNRSAYPLDLVVVEVQYIQANKKIYKTENLYFRGIGAGAALMQEAPKSSRGVRVQYKITTINSKELGLSYSGI